MGSDCKERLNFEFIQFVLWTIKFHFHYEKNIIGRIKDYNSGTVAIDNTFNMTTINNPLGIDIYPKNNPTNAYVLSGQKLYNITILRNWY